MLINMTTKRKANTKAIEQEELTRIKASIKSKANPTILNVIIVERGVTLLVIVDLKGGQLKAT